MKNKFLIHQIGLPIFLIFLAFALNNTALAQDDNPLLDNVQLEWLENINYIDSGEDVIIDSEGYDNFNLGVDFAEPHLTQNPNNPVQFFGAYNINGAWYTNDGHDWTAISPNFGTSVNGDPITAYDNQGNLYYESMYGSIVGCKVIRSTNNGAIWGTSVTSIAGYDKNWMAADQTTGPYANYIYTTMTPGNFARSTNNGTTWTTTATFGTQSLPGMMVCVGPNGATDGGAVYVVTNSGNAFASTYTFYRSTNGGASFSLRSAQNFANYVGTNVNGRNSVENMRTRPYPFIAADQSNGTYRGRLYCVYASNTPSGNGNKPDIFCRYSTNQGSTWSSAIKINDDLNTTSHHQWHPSIWCDKSSGRLYVKWMDTRDTPTSDSAYIYASYSDNGGVTWETNQRISNEKMKINCTSCGGGGTPRYQGDYDAIVGIDNQALMMWTDFRDGSFGSYVGYFPDFAMQVSPATTPIYNLNDTTFISIEIPDVKLYNSSAIFSATVTPTPPNGAIILDFPQGNTLNSFPGNVPLRVRTLGNVSLGTYTINIQGEGPNGTPVHRRTATLDVLLAPVNDPIAFNATAISYSQIDLSFTPNAGNHNVIIVWNFDGIFTTPVGIPPAVGSPFAGGTLLYNGITSPVNHTGLLNGTTYYYKAFSNSGSSYSPGVTSDAQTIDNSDFTANFLVFDNCSNTQNLVFGTAGPATECFDAAYDCYGPPPPPAGALGGWFLTCNEILFCDYKQTNTDSIRIWDLWYQPATGCQLSFGWNPAELPPEGNFHLVDPANGQIVNVNMRTSSTYIDVVGLGHLRIVYNYGVTASSTVAEGWNMISLPLTVADANYLTLFPNAETGSLYGYNGSYYPSDTLDNCEGYWLKFPASELVTIQGDDLTECIVDLNTGWNMIGGPNCSVALGSIGDPGGIIVPGTLYGYSGSYFPATSVDPLNGYWIKASASGTITISCAAPVAMRGDELTIPENTVTDFGKIEISDAGNNAQRLYFNSKLKENISIESFSMPPVSPEGSFDARLMGDYRLSETDEVTIQVQSSNYPLSVKITDLEYEQGYGYVLQEIDGGVEVGSHTIADGVEIVITNKEVSLLKITKQQALPTTYNLEQNYPNPFNPATTIKFSLPEAANVTLTIYNTLGQKITELVNTKLEAGRYSYQWDANNVATGIYIYELRTEKFVSMKKMVLLK